MKVLLDENISPTHARELRAEGHDAICVVEAGLSGACDERVLEFASNEDRILLTLDADFADVLRFSPAKTPGLIRLRLRRPTEEAIRNILRKAILLLHNVDLRGRLAVIEPNKIRVRPRF